MKTRLIVLITALTIGLTLGFIAKPDPGIWGPMMPSNPENFEFTIEAAPFTFISDTTPPKPAPGADVVVLSFTTPFFYTRGHPLRRKNYVSLSSSHPLFEKVLLPEGTKFRFKEGIVYWKE